MRKPVWMLSGAALLAALVGSVYTGHVHAESKEDPYQYYCTIRDPKTGEIEFFTPGEQVLDIVNGRFVVWECRGGVWVMVKGAPPGVRPVRPAGGGVANPRP